MNIRTENSWWLEVWGNNSRWLKRLHNAGFVYHAPTQRWTRNGLTENQAKSLVGRMREAGVKVLIHGRKNSSTIRPYKPNFRELLMLKRIETARLIVNRSLAKKGRKAHHCKDTARKSAEIKQSDSNPSP